MAPKPSPALLPSSLLSLALTAVHAEKLSSCTAGAQYGVVLPEGSRLSRQRVEREVPSDTGTFGSEDLHKTWVWTRPSTPEASGWSALYLWTNDMCGADLYSQPDSVCQRAPDDLAKKHYELLEQDMQKHGSVSRGFGVEYELVARDPPDDVFGWSSQIRLTKCYELKTAEKNQKVKDGKVKCAAHSDCPPGQFCRAAYKKYMMNHSPKCNSRVKCTNETSIDGSCPFKLTSWTWWEDRSVKPLTMDQALAAGAEEPRKETRGVTFELVSPILSKLSGLQAAAETLSLLRHMGVQAGPTQGMHVHVNAVEGSVGGSVLGPKEIHNVWAHYARFQLVIEEMLQDSRSRGAALDTALPLTFAPLSVIRLVSGQDVEPVILDEGGRRMQNIKTIFWNLQKCAVKHPDLAAQHPNRQGAKAICRCIFGKAACTDEKGVDDPPIARYFQVNLIALAWHQTVEFRAFPATTDPERAVRWILFILRFVERYKNDGRFLSAADLGPDDLERSISNKFDELVSAQQSASLKDLQDDMGVDLDYWIRRPWLLRHKACEVSASTRSSAAS